MSEPELKQFVVPEEDRELFRALDRARSHLTELKEILAEYEATEKVLAAQVFSKFGIPPDQTILYHDWVVYEVGGKRLAEPEKDQTPEIPLIQRP